MCFYAIYFHLWVRREGGNLIFITDALDLFSNILGACFVFFFSCDSLLWVQNAVFVAGRSIVMSDFYLPLFLHDA